MVVLMSRNNKSTRYAAFFQFPSNTTFSYNSEYPAAHPCSRLARGLFEGFSGHAKGIVELTIQIAPARYHQNGGIVHLWLDQ